MREEGGGRREEGGGRREEGGGRREEGGGRREEGGGRKEERYTTSSLKQCFNLILLPTNCNRRRGERGTRGKGDEREGRRGREERERERRGEDRRTLTGEYSQLFPYMSEWQLAP